MAWKRNFNQRRQKFIIRCPWGTPERRWEIHVSKSLFAYIFNRYPHHILFDVEYVLILGNYRKNFTWRELSGPSEVEHEWKNRLEEAKEQVRLAAMELAKMLEKRETLHFPVFNATMSQVAVAPLWLVALALPRSRVLFRYR